MERRRRPSPLRLAARGASPLPPPPQWGRVEGLCGAFVEPYMGLLSGYRNVLHGCGALLLVYTAFMSGYMAFMSGYTAFLLADMRAPGLDRKAPGLDMRVPGLDRRALGLDMRALRLDRRAPGLDGIVMSRRRRAAHGGFFPLGRGGGKGQRAKGKWQRRGVRGCWGVGCAR